MSQLSTHVLDTSIGKPAAGVQVTLESFSAGAWKEVSKGSTNNDGRIPSLPAGEERLQSGVYRLIFEASDYFRSQGKNCFFPRVSIEFELSNIGHYHVPLLLSPFGYSTYRGS